MNAANRVDKLVQSTIAGKEITHSEGYWLLTEAPRAALFAGADHLRRRYGMRGVELCSILSVKTGGCSEDCHFCAQSSYWKTECASSGFLNLDAILHMGRKSEQDGIHRFSLVSSGRRLREDDFALLLQALEALRNNCPRLSLCVSAGFLDISRARALRKAGAERYHHNIETSRAHFPTICTTHTFEEKVDTMRAAKEAGLSLCSGGILGLGESAVDRVDMALTLRSEAVDSIPLNILAPIDGTPLSSLAPPNSDEILRTVATWRFMIPKADLRFAGGRQTLAKEWTGAFKTGMSALMTGDYLTTCGNAIAQDKVSLLSAGETLRKSP